MTLIDYETGKTIINPYITVYSPDERSWVAINSSTFGGADGEIEMIPAHDEECHMERIGKGKKLYKIVATVAKINRGIQSVRRSGADDPVSLTPLGHVTSDFVRKCLPQSWEYFQGRQGR